MELITIECKCKKTYHSDVRENYIRAKWERKEFTPDYERTIEEIEGTKEGYLVKGSGKAKVNRYYKMGKQDSHDGFIERKLDLNLFTLLNCLVVCLCVSCFFFIIL